MSPRAPGRTLKDNSGRQSALKCDPHCPFGRKTYRFNTTSLLKHTNHSCFQSTDFISLHSACRAVLVCNPVYTSHGDGCPGHEWKHTPAALLRETVASFTIWKHCKIAQGMISSTTQSPKNLPLSSSLWAQLDWSKFEFLSF